MRGTEMGYLNPHTHDLSTPEGVGQLVADIATLGRTASVLDEIAAERQRQDAKFGEQNWPDGTGPDVRWTPIAATADQVAEDVRFACDERHRTGRVTWLDILLEEFAESAAEGDPAKLRAELVQVAAVAVNWVEAIDRRAE